MPLTRDFKETVQARVRSDPEFRRALLKESVESLLEGDVDTGRAVLRDYINATVGFETLGRLTGKPAKEPDAHVRAGRQSTGAQSVRGHQPPSAPRGHSA